VDALITGHPDLAVTTNEVFELDIRARSCSIDPDVPEDYRKLDFEWNIVDADSTYSFFTQKPVWTFTQTGSYLIYSRCTLTSLAVTRLDTLEVYVTAP